MKTAHKQYLIRECPNPSCNFRFPAPGESGIGVQCPKCKSPTSVLHVIDLDPDTSKNDTLTTKNNPHLEVFLDNIRSTFNVGAMFRTADGAGIKKIHLGGITPLPNNKKIHKTALGAETSIDYQYHPNGLEAVRKFKEQGYRIWALEKTDFSVDLTSIHLSQDNSRTLLIVGNEIVGIDPDILEICDLHIEIPMSGMKGSLNVAIAYGIAVYFLLADKIFIHQ